MDPAEANLTLSLTRGWSPAGNVTTAPADDYIFDRADVRFVFITLYTVVFCCCFFGNLMVILVVTLSRRLRSITNFFLANLAVADFCVGVFCVFQNLSIYLITNWVLGDFLCKMYQFVHSLSYTASIFILVVICTERYFAIIHPITCKQILTPRRLRLAILAVWITSALYSAPRFFWVQTITTPMHHGVSETMCIAHRKKYNSELYDMINFVFLYVVPLAVMTVLYTKIAVGLWTSSKKLEKHLNVTVNFINTSSTDQQSFKRNCKPFAEMKFSENGEPRKLLPSAAVAPAQLIHSTSSQNVLRARRGVIRMLIIVVLTFALCNLPFHARKMWQYWSSGYEGSSDFSTLFTPLTFLVTYFNSGVNPLLYAFLSRNFRRGMWELILCTVRRGGNHRHTMTVRGELLRQSSMKSTNKVHTTHTTMETVLNNELSSDCSHS